MRDPDLAAELVEMVDVDLTVRSELLAKGLLHGGYHPRMREVHQRHGKRLHEVLNLANGWPGYDLVGQEGAHAAWLIAQHDIANPPLMRRAVVLLSEAVAADQADPESLAKMIDRIRYFEGRSQLYGTNRDWCDDGTFGIWPPVDSVELADERRKAIGMQALAAAAQDRADSTQVLHPTELAAWREKIQEFARSVGWRPPGEPLPPG